MLPTLPSAAMIVQAAPSMSRSRRKALKVAVTSAHTERGDKAEAHRRTRHATRISVQAALREGEDAVLVDDEHPRSGQWRFAKDERRWVGVGATQRRWKASRQKLQKIISNCDRAFPLIASRY